MRHDHVRKLALPATSLSRFQNNHHITAYLSCQIAQVARYLSHEISLFGSDTPFVTSRFGRMSEVKTGGTLKTYEKISCERFKRLGPSLHLCSREGVILQGRFQPRRTTRANKMPTPTEAHDSLTSVCGNPPHSEGSCRLSKLTSRRGHARRPL